MVSILRACRMMVSSRYHGIVTSMPALVPSAGITMDERIRNLMNERGHQELLMNVDDPDLEARTAGGARNSGSRRRADRRRNRAHGGPQFENDGAHGRVFRRGSAAAISGISHAAGEWSWEDYLPPMSEGLKSLVQACS